jgi:hypothetical protein
MISTTWTQAPAGMPAAGLDVRPRACRRAPEAFTTPYQGTGLPFAGRGVDVPVGTSVPAPQLIATNVHIGTTLGIHSSRRPPG